MALAGNPNVGKSTVFNQLTGLNQHTGNWPGKTVFNATGYCYSATNKYKLVDLPGIYSLLPHSYEEEIARDYICFEHPHIVIVVCDATCLQRNLNLVLQIMEIHPHVILCLNLMDEAKRKKIHIDIDKLSNLLNIPVIPSIAKNKSMTRNLLKFADDYIAKIHEMNVASDTHISTLIQYPLELECSIDALTKILIAKDLKNLSPRWLALQLLSYDIAPENTLYQYLDVDFPRDEELTSVIETEHARLFHLGIDSDTYKLEIVSALQKCAQSISTEVIQFEDKLHNTIDRKLDQVFTSKKTGYPIMLILLTFIFWLTIVGANYPSTILANYLFRFQDVLIDFFIYLNTPLWLYSPLVLGVYRVLAWVISVMLPPMAIFFPLFTLLEDIGYLPRIAYNLDKPFQKCNACGKQALCMCMGFGCNAVGVMGCRIIDSKRERFLAILTNSFVPCNGRFPTLIAILTMFFIGTSGGVFSSLTAALYLSGFILLSILITLLITKILSVTVLQGMPSSFTLELPSYRIPQVGKVIVRSIFDRTLFVLGRAIIVAAPAGFFIWLMANITLQQISVLTYCADFLDPFARILGLDGIILLAFILGFPANEIVLPIIIMGYLSEGSLLELDSLSQMKDLFVANGWSYTTAICTMIFMLFHWPCSTTVLTIKKETNSICWSLLAIILPTLVGMLLCITIHYFSLILHK
ncbi:MAG: ferrous iron transport protein B [Eubacteriales bacterium]